MMLLSALTIPSLAMAMFLCSSSSSRLSQDTESVVKRLDVAFGGNAAFSPAVDSLHQTGQEGGSGLYGADGCKPFRAPRLGSRYSLPSSHSKSLQSGLVAPASSVIPMAGRVAATHVTITVSGQPSAEPWSSEADSPHRTALSGSPTQVPASGSTWGSPSSNSPDGQRGLDGETAGPGGISPVGSPLGRKAEQVPEAVVKQRSPVRDLTEQFEAATREAAAGKGLWPSATQGAGASELDEEEGGEAPECGEQMYGLEAEFQREASEGNNGVGLMRGSSRLALSSRAWDAAPDGQSGDGAHTDEERTIATKSQLQR